MSAPLYGYGRRPIRSIADDTERYFGKYRGIVVHTNDPELLGRVRAQVPYPFGDIVLNWATPCLPSNFFVLPNVGQGVWIEFENGDPRLPVWTGMWFRPGEPPFQVPYTTLQTNDEDTTLRPEDQAIHDRSLASNQYCTPHILAWMSKTGHYIKFDDWQGSGGTSQVIVQDRDGRNLTLTADGFVELSNKDGSATIQIKDDGTITIKTNGDVYVGDGSGNVYLGNGTGTKKLMTKDDADALENLINTQIAGHTHATPSGPSGPPTNAAFITYTETLTTQTQAT